MKRYKVQLFNISFPDDPYGDHAGTALYDARRDQYAIFLNTQLDPDERQRTLAHELWHVVNGDLQSNKPVRELEAGAEAFVQELYGNH